MSGAAADRNLLLGIIALQMDFISRDALIAAMHAWALSKKTPLSQILQVQAALTESRRSLLDALVDEHIKLHDGDPRKSLASVSSIGSVRDELSRIADPDVQASLPHVAAARSDRVNDPQRTVTQPAVGDSTSAGAVFAFCGPMPREDWVRFLSLAIPSSIAMWRSRKYSRSSPSIRDFVPGSSSRPRSRAAWNIRGLCRCTGSDTYPTAARFMRCDSYEGKTSRTQSDGFTRQRTSRGAIPAKAHWICVNYWDDSSMSVTPSRTRTIAAFYTGT